MYNEVNIVKILSLAQVLYLIIMLIEKALSVHGC